MFICVKACTAVDREDRDIKYFKLWQQQKLIRKKQQPNWLLNLVSTVLIIMQCNWEGKRLFFMVTSNKAELKICYLLLFKSFRWSWSPNHEAVDGRPGKATDTKTQNHADVDFWLIDTITIQTTTQSFINRIK